MKDWFFARCKEVWMCGFQSTRYSKRIPVVMAKGSHLFPYRTQKLSLSAPMVLGWRRPGRVGHCRIPKRKHPTYVGCFLFVPSVSQPSRVILAKSRMDLVGTGASRRQWREQASGASGIARSDGMSRLCEFPGRLPAKPNAWVRLFKSPSDACWLIIDKCKKKKYTEFPL